ncbi:hypothetical protein COX08_03515 [Candidatus Beckwithbacteria bacterium CG23_combo_of_CG06-09_8_20_14_all_34_8]|uniref:MazG nucleotide pyrophosphohydrolase n=1 Tax=Candidatus Beckwithbacteria bacterium CG23_combo_of_CG06-09_8_20_14_all_34_8 TaxID=1974497 RepID=A0A2H0B5P1_9BACT|nr:MAG: hypothetical protein COX08_03515 [Candidatus Beckwithbacteria bacterium CG23_combo_of_CG06-09_8_20_14_all_34_8]
MKSVVVCASKKYKDEVAQFCNKLQKLGVLLFEPSISKPIFEDEKFTNNYITNVIFKGLTLEHFDWIRKADVCYIFNKDGYVGTSVSLEMGYATALGKPLFALEAKTGDPCRDSLIDKVVKTPQLLVNLL